MLASTATGSAPTGGLTLDNSTINLASRVNTSAALTLNSAALILLANNNASAATTQTLGALTLGSGQNLINAGYVTLALKYGTRPNDLPEAIESLSTKVGLVLLVLGVMHFFNLYVFSRLRRRALLKVQKPPVLPEQFIEPVQSWSH